MTSVRLTAEELRRAGIRLFGEAPGWQSRLAETIGVDRSAVTRWLSASVPVPLYASLLVRYMLAFGTPEAALKDDVDARRR
jgi:transcriptional regulator with XRE-family HTH domain